MLQPPSSTERWPTTACAASMVTQYRRPWRFALRNPITTGQATVPREAGMKQADGDAAPLTDNGRAVRHRTFALVLACSALTSLSHRASAPGSHLDAGDRCTLVVGAQKRAPSQERGLRECCNYPAHARPTPDSPKDERSTLRAGDTAAASMLRRWSGDGLHAMRRHLAQAAGFAALGGTTASGRTAAHTLADRGGRMS